MIKNIAIIGAGWVGCHLAKHLINRYNVDIFEAKGIFSGSSMNNQNRLHLGFHYARNYRTRLLCKDTFSKFIKEYGDFIYDVPLNLYAISNKSIIDFKTYKDIFTHNQFNYKEYSVNYLDNIEGSIYTDEKYIDFTKISDYFKVLLDKNLIYKTISDIKELENYDLIINCTNNIIKNPELKSFYEITLSLLYKLNSKIDFGALTVVDGNFFSIFPYKKDYYSLTDVEYTPLFTSQNLNKINNFKDKIDNSFIKSRQKLMEDKVISIYPKFKEKFIYADYYLSLKSKFYSNSADRYPIISNNGKIIHCFTGKIQGIYYIQSKIEEYIKNENFNR